MAEQKWGNCRNCRYFGSHKQNPEEQELANWFPGAVIDPLADRYRALYPELAIESATVFAGAREALAAVRRHGGRSLVVTGKHGPNARLHVDLAHGPAAHRLQQAVLH